MSEENEGVDQPRLDLDEDKDSDANGIRSPSDNGDEDYPQASLLDDLTDDNLNTVQDVVEETDLYQEGIGETEVQQETENIASPTPDADGDEGSPINTTKRLLDSDDEGDGAEDLEKSSPRKRIFIEDDDSDDDLKKLEAAALDSDDEDVEPPSETDIPILPAEQIYGEEQEIGQEISQGDNDEANESAGKDNSIIKNIFGDSGSEDEDFEGFNKTIEDTGEKPAEEDNASQVAKDLDTSSEDEDNRPRHSTADMVYDFDIMMQKKREENYRRRKRKNIDIINDSDDVIAEMISQMKAAADDDFTCNKEQKPALNKLKLLPQIENSLHKIDLREALLDAGVLGVITDWLTPLPDRSLPNIKIRELMLQVLHDFNINDTERLKASGIGKAVMYLFKHPKESRENKIRAQRLIQAWSRPIFNNDVDFHSISREEREQRDLDLMPSAKKSRNDDSRKEEPKKVAGPGEKGWVPRARVPAPSTKSYVHRPKSQVEEMTTRGSGKKQVSRLEQLQRSMAEKKRQSRCQRAVKISIEGRRM